MGVAGNEICRKSSHDDFLRNLVGHVFMIFWGGNGQFYKCQILKKSPSINFNRGETFLHHVTSVFSGGILTVRTLLSQGRIHLGGGRPQTGGAETWLLEG